MHLKHRPSEEWAVIQVRILLQSSGHYHVFFEPSRTRYYLVLAISQNLTRFKFPGHTACSTVVHFACTKQKLRGESHNDPSASINDLLTYGLIDVDKTILVLLS